MELADKKRSGDKKVIFVLPEEWHTDIKMRATIQNISMKDWILRAIIDKAKKDDLYEQKE